MPARQRVEVYQVYIDTQVLVDLADPDADRHRQAQALIRLFQRYQRPRQLRTLQLVTSAWAVAEAHGVLYQNALERNGVAPPVRAGRVKKVRDTVPPFLTELENAGRQVDTLLSSLQATTSFALLNDATPNITQVWQLVGRIGREAAIYPADSVHLALALQTGCAMLVTDDADFLDKIECCRDTLIQPYRAREFSYFPNLPPFQFCGLRESTSIIPGRPQRSRPAAIRTLNGLGFR